MAKRALITGVTGQDGSFLAEQLLAKGYEVCGIIRRLSTPNLVHIQHILDRITLLDADLSDQSSLNNAVREAQPDEVYNLAAQSFVQTSFKQPTLTSDVTGVGVVRMLEAVRHHAPHARFYQASTSELYGKVQEEPQTERTPFYPRSPYGFAKLMGYWAVVNYRESYNMHASNGILFNHESERRGIEFVTRKITHSVAEIAYGLRKELRLGNLDARRDWGYAPEYTEGMWRMLQQPHGDDYVLATNTSYTVAEFAQLAFQAAGINDWQKYVVEDSRFYRPAEVHTLRGDAKKAKTVLGWEAKTHVPELVKIMVKADLAMVGAGKPVPPRSA
ncbi:MAG TPA: GDP-mannose 4,6-dehydratase [Candidatus Thermoplasmatota archaeon]|nr:GDP-mannose 4,6-dehydratase [Candidatus Thermoplasmatota archaeon]